MVLNTDVFSVQMVLLGYDKKPPVGCIKGFGRNGMLGDITIRSL